MRAGGGPRRRAENTPDSDGLRRARPGAVVAAADGMSLHATHRSDVCHDGFGSRYAAQDPQFGPVEVLELTAALGTAAAEQAIRACAARQADADTASVARVVRMARKGHALSITTITGPGVPLSDLLAALEFGTITLGDAAMLEVANATVAALAVLHRLPGAPAHGALCPPHAIVRRDGSVGLTGTVFGDALQGLQWNREQVWRIFAVALPPSASLPRFDQRSDVTQLGALVVAMLMRRALTPAEYPKQTLDLVETATEGMAISARCRTALRLWLQQTLQLQPKALFASAADAARAFADVVADVEGRRAATAQLQRAVRELTGEQVLEEPPAPARAPQRMPASPPPPRAATPRGLPFLRSVFPALGAN